MLDERLRSYVSRAAGAPQPWELELTELRAGIDAEAAELWGEAGAVDVVEERDLPDLGRRLRVRVYRPRAAGPLPGLVWFHGGGWVVGSLDSHDRLCRGIAVAAACCVVSVDYRLAPEHPYPAAVDDAWEATAWAAREAATLGLDPRRLAVGGDSAGGNLAAVVALRARDHGLPLGLQVLVYPVTDCRLDTASYVEHGVGLNLTRARMDWYLRAYVADGDATDPEVSPLRAPDLTGVAPALVQTAELDPLLTEGEAYAARLSDAGVPVTLTRYDSMIHGFIRMPMLVPAALQAVDQIAAAVRVIDESAPSRTNTRIPSIREAGE